MNIRHDLTNNFNQQISAVNSITDPRKAALILAEAGIWVLPKAIGRKDPNMKGWQDKRCNDAAQINRWFDTGFYDGLLLKPSPITLDNGQQAYLIFLDCDGLAVYDVVCNQFPILRDTRTELTGSEKGYRIPLIVDNLPSVGKGKITRKGILGTDNLGFEIFIKTGVVVVAPSIHPETHKRYKLVNPAPVIHLDDIDELAQWALSLPAKNDKKKKTNTRPISMGQGEVPTEVSTAIVRALGIERVNSEGWSDPLACIFHKHEHDLEKPGAAWNTQKNFFYCHKCGQSWNAKETAAARGIDWPKPPPRPKRSVQHYDENKSEGQQPKQNRSFEESPWPPKLSSVSIEKPAVNAQVNSRYLSEANLPDTARTLAVRSTLGSGKNHWVIQHINQHQPRRILYITFQQSLTENATERLNESVQGDKFEHYLNIPNEFNLALIDRLVVSSNSLYRCANGKPYDLVVIDEMEQVVPSLWSGTLHGSEIPRAYQVLINILKSAGQVIALDAHFSPQSADFLRHIRAEITVVENSYRPTRPAMALYHYESKLIGSALDCAEQNPDLPTVITTSSRKVARRYRRLFVAIYGADKVQLIYGWNSHEKLIRCFLKSINNNLPRLRVLITSPTVGTGVDVTCDIAGVFGYFPGNHLAPTAMLQQIARYRNARTFGVTIPNIESNAPENTDELLSRTRFKVQQTRTLAEVTGNDVSTEQAEITKLWASYTALHNRLSNRPLSTFTELAQSEGFPILWVDGRSESLQKQLKEAQEEQQKEDDSLTLSLTPISTDEMDRRRMSGNLIEADHLAHRRWKFEDTTGQTIAPDSLARYPTPAKLRTLVRFTTYQFGGMTEAKRLDRSEIEGILPFKRSIAALNSTFLDGLLKAAFGKKRLQSTEEVAEEELIRRIAPYLEAHEETIRALDDRRNDLSKKAIATFRRMLGRFGIRLTYRRVRVEKKLSYSYALDRDSLTVIIADAEQRWEMLQNKLFQNAGISIPNIRDLEQMKSLNSEASGVTGSRLPSTTLNEDYITRRRALGLPTNPFSTQAGATYG